MSLNLNWLKDLFKCRTCEASKLIYESRIADLVSERDLFRDQLFQVVRLTNTKKVEIEVPLKSEKKVANLKSWPHIQRALEENDAKSEYWKRKADEFGKELDKTLQDMPKS